MNLPRWTAYVALAVVATLLVSAIPKRRSEPARLRPVAASDVEHPRVVVLGIDGMDPDILQDVMDRYPEGMANFRRLAAAGGGVGALGTSYPPQSPVAWSNFITGRRPGGHGIFDFIHRDPETYDVAASTVKLEEGDSIGVPFTDLKLPTGGGSEPNRSGRAFWSELMDAGVPADLYRVPINYPVEPADGVSFPGMLTPALDSPYGIYTVYTTDPPIDTSLGGGNYRLIRVRSGAARTTLAGPTNVFEDGDPQSTTPLTFYVDEESAAVVVELGEDRVVMQEGQWSRFMAADFGLLPMGAMNLRGIVRFYVKSVSPELVVYASPVNFDPAAPADTISLPEDASADLAKAIGPYFTQGMAEEVNALKDGVFTDEEFMRQANLVLVERERMLDYALDRYAANEGGGLLFFYVSSVDLSMHMMWRHTDPEHPAYDARVAAEDSSWWSGRDETTWADVVDDLYLKMDVLLGRVLDRVGDNALVMVMSDHGFAPYRREFALNTWLLEQGFLVLKEGETRQLPTDDPAYVPVSITTAVDWSKTRAYGMGFNGLYLNLKGREAEGIVEPGAEAERLLADLKARLERIDDRGTQVVLVADLASDVYAGGERLAEAPDIVVGYNWGYGNSDAASQGRIPHAVLSDNTGGTFNGSHLMHPSVVNGTLLTNGNVTVEDPRLEDLTTSILDLYGVAPTDGMVGRKALEKPNN
ncbi:MAG: alkaline phosphatase family protein [Planctomycetota bacterium]